MFAAMRAGDLLVHHPYDSFSTSVERFVEQAADDPDVLAIKLTVYRTSDDTPLVPALIRATERGKQAVCLVELKARFDERAEHPVGARAGGGGRARRLRPPGAQDARQVHPRRAPRGRRRAPLRAHRDRQLPPARPRACTPTSACSPADEEIGADVADMFNFLTGYARPRRYRKVLVAPELPARRRSSTRSSAPSAAHEDGEPARIAMKMNSLVDRRCIRALYRASQAGVPVDLNVRGICCLVPGVAGRVGEHPRELGRRALPRALADLRASSATARRRSTSARPT